MRPRLKNSTLYVPSAEGVYIISNSGTLTLKGKQIYQWLDTIAPYLDGKRTLVEITNGLSENRRELVGNLVRALHDKGFVKDVTGELPHTLDAEETAIYASEIAFIDYYVDSPAHRFERYRNSPILAIGSGLTLTALVHAQLHSGIRQVQVAPTAECSVNRKRHAELLELARQRDRRQSLVELPLSDRAGEAGSLEAALAPFEAVIHVSDRPMLGRAHQLNRACVRQGKRLIQAVVQGDRAWLGPLVGAGEDAACWECAWLRRLGHRPEPAGPDVFADHPDAPVSEFLTAPPAAIVSNQLGFEIFKYVTGGAPLETGGTLVALDLETLESKAHPVVRHPLCEAHGDAAGGGAAAGAEPAVSGEADLVEAIRRREQGAELDAQAFSKQATRLFDDVTGILGALGEHELEQLPLKVCQAAVSNPMAIRGLGQPLTAMGYATDFAQARQRATQRACELYAVGIVDRRRVAARDDRGPAADQLWGYDLAAATARRVRAGAVFPVLDGALPSQDSAPGLASGLSWSEAVVRGLLGQCRRLTIAESQRATTPFGALDLSAVPRTGHMARYGRTLAIAGESLAIHDITGSLEVPTFAGCLGDETVCYVSGLDVPEAVETVFEHAVLSYQARANRQPAVAPAAVPPLPSHLRGSLATIRRSGAVLPWPEKRDFLVRQLVRGGWHPVAALLDHDPAVDAVLPYVVNVILLPVGAP